MCQAVTTDVDVMITQSLLSGIHYLMMENDKKTGIEIIKDEYQVEKVPNR